MSSNSTITNVDLGSVIHKDAEMQDGDLAFTAAGTVLAGTILARDSVTGVFVPYVIGGVVNENGIPKAVITYDVTAVIAGEIPVRAMISGMVRKSRLIIDADGDDSNLTFAIVDELRDYSITCLEVQELNILDNQ